MIKDPSLLLPSQGRGKLNKKKRGNISILVIFVLLASGIIGILTMHFVRQIVHYNGVINAYYKSYYLARAGLEVSLTQITERGVGFDYDIVEGDAIINDNFSCSPNCSVTTEIVGKSAYINHNAWNETGCTDENMFVLARGESLVLPLFIDAFEEANNIIDSLGDIIYSSKFPIDLRIDYDKQGTQAKKYTLGLVTDGYPVLSKQYSDTDYNDNISDFLGQNYINSERRLSTGNYLILSNSADYDDKKTLNFCLHIKKSNSSNHKLALPYAHIKSIGTYQHKTLGLEALYQHNVLPSFLSHTSLGN